jgi:hypothetical protein
MKVFFEAIIPTFLFTYLIFLLIAVTSGLHHSELEYVSDCGKPPTRLGYYTGSHHVYEFGCFLGGRLGD